MIEVSVFYLPGSVTDSVQIVSATHSSLKATFLNPAPNVETVGKAYIPKMGDETRHLRLPRSSSVVNWQSRPLHDLQDTFFLYFLGKEA